MRGYQSISSADIDAIENGDAMPATAAAMTTTATTTSREEEDGRLSPSRRPPRLASSSSSPPPPLRSRCAAWIGLVAVVVVFVAFVGGVVGSRGSLARHMWGYPSSSPSGIATSTTTTSRRDDGLAMRGKSFYDSLPFEEVLPPGGRDGAAARPSSSSSSMMDGTVAAAAANVDVLAAVLLGAPSSSSSSSSTSVSSASSSGGGGGTAQSSGSSAVPHVLYHATPTAFGLLYDPSRSYSGYLSEYALDYFLINSGGFDAQDNQAYCAVASVSTLLNSLRYSKRFRDGDDPSGWSFDLPTDPRYDPYPYATQSDVLDGACVRDNVVERGDGSDRGDGGGVGGGGGVGTPDRHFDGIFRPPYGLSLEQAGKLLNCHANGDWIVTVVNVDPGQVSLLKMRYDLKAALIDPDARVMINYDRKGLGQVGGGHFSPLGAYHSSTDSFLIMDVAKYKYPPVWVGADTLHGAMATVDRCGTYDYPRGQERLMDRDAAFSDGGTAGAGTSLFDPMTHDEYEDSLRVLNCKERFRGYIILKKRGSTVN